MGLTLKSGQISHPAGCDDHWDCNFNSWAGESHLTLKGCANFNLSILYDSLWQQGRREQPKGKVNYCINVQHLIAAVTLGDKATKSREMDCGDDALRTFQTRNKRVRGASDSLSQLG